MAVLGRSRQDSACRCTGRHAFGAWIPARCDFVERVLVEARTGECLFHLRAHRTRIGADQARPIAALDAPDQARNVFEVRLQKVVEISTHSEAEDAAWSGQRGIHLLELVELLLQEVKLRQRIVEKVGLDPEILQHLLKLTDFLGDVLSIDRGHALCPDGTCKSEAKRKCRGTGGKGTGQALDHRKLSKVKSMNCRSAACAAAMASCSSLRGWV